ncbi:hypothetical protein [Flavobacterium sp. ZS1P14]|uniref:hypothetical protein n=1 Tax=Flavobacterium sp. ZS1P14 TaxID=3401729 RepID=UPI003AABBADA
MDGLKLNDRPKAEALILAAQKAGFYAKLGLVTSYQSGALETDHHQRPSKHRYSRSYYDDFNDYHDNENELAENGTMGEIYDEYIEIEHWMQEGVPPVRNIHLEERDLIAAITLNDGEPIEKEAEGYTGNAGMEMQYWYHYGAVFLWSKKHHYHMLVNLKPANKLEWIDYYNKNWSSIEVSEKALIKKLVETGLYEDNLRRESDYSPLVDWLITLNDEKYLQETAKISLVECFALISVENWSKLFETYQTDNFKEIFATVAKKGKIRDTNHLLTILKALLLHNDTHETFVINQIDQIPSYLLTLQLSEQKEKAITKAILKNILDLDSYKTADSSWIKNTTHSFTRVLNREFVNTVLVSVVLESGNPSRLAKQIMTICKEDLRSRIENKPQPPADWSRPVPQTNNKVWAILKPFLESPDEQTFNYKKIQADRTEMENAIRHVIIDLKMETIKKGSPHILRITKTEAAYQIKLSKWMSDVALLKETEISRFN